MDNIINYVCEYYKVDTKELIGRSRKPIYVIPRHMVQYLMKNELNMNYSQIAKVFNRRHNSIMHGVKCIDIQLTNRIDQSIKNDLISLKQNLLNYEQSRF
jgi:chromosomal replication initiator protein